MRRVDLSRDEETRAWQEFGGSYPQQVLHNLLLEQIEEHRTRLESAPADEVAGIQTALREARRFLGIIHEHDTQAIQRIYGS